MSLVWANLREAPLVYGPLWLDVALTASVNSRSLFSLRKSLDPNADRSTTQSRAPLSEAFAVASPFPSSPDDKPVYRDSQHSHSKYQYDYEYGHNYNHHSQNHPGHYASSQAHLLNQPVPYSQSELSYTVGNSSHQYYLDDPYNPRPTNSPRTSHSHLRPQPHLNPDHQTSYPYNMYVPTRTSASSSSSSLHSTEDRSAYNDPHQRHWVDESQGPAIPLVDFANSPTSRHGTNRTSNTSASGGPGIRSSAGSGTAGSRPTTAHTVNIADTEALDSPGGAPTNLGGRLSTSAASLTVGLTPVRRQTPNALFTYESYQQDASHITGTGVAL